MMRPPTSVLLAPLLVGCAHAPVHLHRLDADETAEILCQRLVVDAQLANGPVSESTFVGACVDAVAPKIGSCLELKRSSPEANQCLDEHAGTVMNELFKSVAGTLAGTLLGNALELEQRTPAERRARCNNAKGSLADSCALANRAVSRPHFESAGALAFVGSLEQTTVRRELEGRIVDLRPCARLVPGVHGQLVLQLTIDRHGEVIDTLVRDSTVGDAKVESCLGSTVKKWIFDRPTNDGVEVVTWPLAIRP